MANFTYELHVIYAHVSRRSLGIHQSDGGDMGVHKMGVALVGMMMAKARENSPALRGYLNGCNKMG